jgi:PAS domain S-box-containing protein
MRRVDGQWRWFYSRDKVFRRTPDGRLHKIIGVAQDITDRKQAEIDLQIANERFELAAAAVNCLIYDWDLQNGRVERTCGLTQILGYSLEEAEPTAQWWQELVNPQDFAKVNSGEAWENFASNGRYCDQYRVRHQNGNYIWVEDRGIAVKDNDGNIIRIIGTTTDISDRKKAEIELQESAERLKLAQSAANAGCWDWDIVNNRVTWSEEYYDLYGLDSTILPSYQNWLDSIREEDREQADRQVREAIEQQSEINIEFRIQHPIKGIRWLNAIGSTFYNPEGKPIQMIGITLDITDRKQAELALRQSQECLQRMVDTAPIGIGIGNSKGEVLGINDTLLQMYGYTRQEYEQQGMNWQDYTLPEYAEMDRQAIKQLQQFGTIAPAEKEIRRKDNTHLLVSISATRWKDDTDEHVAFLVDLSDRKHIEETLQEKEQQLRLALEAADMVAYRWDIASDRAIQSPNVDRVFGLPLGTTIQTGTEFFSLIHPEDRERVIKAIDDAIAGRQDYRTEFRLVCPDGNVRWMADRGWMSFDRSGTKAICLRGVIFDITARKESELLLSKNVAILNAINNATSTLIFAKDLSGKVIVANPATISLIGKPESEIIGYTDLEFLSDREQAERMMSNDRRVMETGQIEVFEETLDLPEGKRTFLTTKSPYRDKAGNIIGVIGVATDITKRKQTQQKLAQQAQLLDLADEGIFVRDLNSRITYWNHGAEQMYGWTSKEAIRQVSYTLLKTKFAIAAAKGGSEETHSSFSGTDLNAILLQTGHWEGELIHTRRNGEQITIDSRQILMRDEQGNPTGILQVNRDITERKRIEIALRQNEERLRSFFEANVIGVIYGDVYGNIHGNIHTANDEFLRIVGYSREVLEAGGLSWINITPPEYLPLDRERVAEARATGACTPYEKEYIRADGSRVPVLVGYGLVGEAREESVAFVLDLSDRKQAEINLRESEERLRLATTGADLGMWFWYLPKNELIWTDKCKALFGLSLDTQISYEVFLKCLHPDDRDRTHEAVNRSLAEKIDYDIEYRTVWLDGSIHWIAARGKGFYDTQGNAIRMMGTVQDITARKQSEEALRRSEEFNRRILDSSKDCIKVVDLEGRLLYLNAGGQELMEIEDLTLYLKKDWICFWQDEDRESVQEAIAIAAAGGIGKFEGCCPTAKGNPKWWEVVISPILDAAGQTERLLSISRDVTARKKREEERVELLIREQTAREESERANRVKDEFLAILSHELRSPLNPILGWTQMLQTYQFDADKIKQGITTIDRNAKLLNQLIDDLLDVNRILRGKLTLNVASVNLAFAIEAAIETVRNAAIAKSISIQTNLLPVGKVSGDSGRLQQIVGNLLSNAVKFTPNGGCIEIKLEQIEQGSRGAEEQGSRGAGKNAGSSISSASGPLSPSAPQPLGLSAYSYAKITVSDTGKGIAPEFLPYIFEHFRQADASVTRNHGGLGLGLAIVRYLVELHGGEVIAESLGVDRGATFTVTLPLLNQQPESDKQDNLSDYELDLTGVRVLVVDDEPDTREFLAIALEQYQAEVMAVSSAMEVSSALRTFQPNILVSDIGMPGIDGYTLLRSIRSLPPEQGGQIPAIALTAYAREEDSQQALSAGFQVHLAKPIEPHLLAETIFLLSC